MSNHGDLINTRKTSCSNDSTIIGKILGADYNRNKIPGGTVDVEVEVWVQEITSLSDITSDFQLDIYISEMWLDRELRLFSNNFYKKRFYKVKNILCDPVFWDLFEVWNHI